MSQEKEYQLRLYVAGETPKSLLALRNLKRYCEEHIKDKYCIEIIDLLENPQLAEGDQILAIPTLVRRFPAPIRKIIGDLSNEDKVLVGLDLRGKTLSPSKNKKDYILRLYITGATHHSMLAVKNIKSICENYLQGRYVLEIVDIYQQPHLAAKEQIIATPTLIRFEPKPPCRLVGDMSNTQKVLNGLDLALRL